MRILFAVHGYPADIEDEAALLVQISARALAGAGAVVCVAAGTNANDGGEARSADLVPASDARIEVVRLSRSDLHPEHWQKSQSASIPERFRRLIREFEPDVVHVHHWRRLSRDLVACAAAERVPAVVSLHDLWSSCLLATRKRPADGSNCDATFAPMPCLACAGSVPPRTPFMPIDQLFLSFGSHRADLERELKLARALLASSAEQAERAAHFLADEMPAVRAVAHDNPAALLATYERAITAGPPAAPPDVDAWYAPRMRAFAEETWDRGLTDTPRSELGYETPSRE
ncbi:MAG: glycosyltransferase [Planctomycetes bacterium]|nr:glycosyltransferase [Planctomycetota bacterium]